jgi:pimeloyl-ACP methyl ester carboxylesterase
MKVFDRSGHAPQVEQPGEFIAEIVDFAAPAAV